VSLAVCTITTEQRGAAIASVRCIVRKGQTHWSPGRATEPLERIAAAAQWIAEQLRPASNSVAPRLLICLDPADASCGWLSAAGSDDRAVKAAVRAVQSGDSDTDHASTASPTWLKTGTVDEDLAVQSLNGSANGTNDAPHKTLGKKAPAAPLQRLAILAVPDLAARLLRDELDRLEVPVVRVMTLWHAIAAAWHNDGPEPVRSAAAADLQPLAATIVLDPAGRLLWTWQRAGRLLAAGSIRLALRHAQVAAAPAGLSANPESLKDQLAASELAAGEAPNATPGSGKSIGELEVSSPDLGRLAADWLGWATQLGIAPSLIALVGPEAVLGPSADTPETSPGRDDQTAEPSYGLASIGASLARLWPGAPIQAVTNDDPITATLTALLDGDEPAGFVPPDPRKEAVDLAQRPSRNSRRVYQWTAAAVASGGVVVAAAGYKLGTNVATTQAEAETQGADKAALLDKVKAIAPNVGKERDVQAYLRKRLDELVKDKNSIVLEKPIVPEVARLLMAISATEGLEITRLIISSNVGNVMFKAQDADTASSVGPTINAIAPTLGDYLVWNGTSSMTSGNVTLNLRGAWETRQNSARPAGSGSKPGPKNEKKPDAKSGAKSAANPDTKTEIKAEPKPAAPDGSSPADGNRPPIIETKPAPQPPAPPVPTPTPDSVPREDKNPTPTNPEKEPTKSPTRPTPVAPPPSFAPAGSPGINPNPGDFKPEPGKGPRKPLEPATQPS